MTTNAGLGLDYDDFTDGWRSTEFHGHELENLTWILLRSRCARPPGGRDPWGAHFISPGIKYLVIILAPLLHVDCGRGEEDRWARPYSRFSKVGKNPIYLDT